MNTSVNFSIAKLLKEKGFGQKLTDRGYNVNGEESFDYTLDRINGVGIAAPTIAEVIMWLYKEHGIWIEVRKVNYSRFDYKIINGTESLMYVKPQQYNSLLSPTEACEAAIEYTLKNLI